MGTSFALKSLNMMSYHFGSERRERMAEIKVARFIYFLLCLVLYAIIANIKKEGMKALKWLKNS